MSFIAQHEAPKVIGYDELLWLTDVREAPALDRVEREAFSKIYYRNKYPPAKPEVLRLLAPQRGLIAIAKSKPKTEKTTNGRLPELSNFESPPAEPGVYHD